MPLFKLIRGLTGLFVYLFYPNFFSPQINPIPPRHPQKQQQQQQDLPP